MNFAPCRALAAASLLALSGVASAGVTIDTVNNIMDIGIDTSVVSGLTPSTPAPWINARFKDLGFLAGGPFASLAKTMELQITVSPTDTPNPGCCDVPGLGNIGAGNSMKTIWLNATGLDLTKLHLEWTGLPALGFPVPGVQPVSVTIAEDGFDLGGNKFDIAISFDPGLADEAGRIESKLLFSYEDPGVDLDVANFIAPTADRLLAAADIRNATGASGIIAAVPEPGSFALLGAMLAGFGVVTRRAATPTTRTPRRP